MDFDQLFKNPDQYLMAFEPPNAIFLKMDRGAYHRSIFCDGRIQPLSKQAGGAPIGDLVSAQASRSLPAPDISYIFHMAHCGSTLLARAIDCPGENLVIREPLSLRQLAIEGAPFSGDAPPRDWAERLALTAQLLSRRYVKEGPVIVKANVPVNFILPNLLALNETQRPIMLYFGLEPYLMAILRTPNHAKWVINIVRELNAGIRKIVPLTDDMTPAQCAGALWLAQIRIYADALHNNPGAASLDAEVLFTSPAEAVGNSFAHFGQPQSGDKIAEIIGGDLFSHYSKNPKVEFDNSSRLDRRERLREELSPIISEAREWVRTAMATTPIPERLPNPLAGESAPLLAEF